MHVIDVPSNRRRTEELKAVERKLRARWRVKDEGTGGPTTDHDEVY